MAPKGGRPENLIKSMDQTPEERRKAASKAGIASGEARRANKTFREALEWALALPAEQVIDGKLGKELAKAYPGLTARDAIAISATRAATKKQDVKAMAFARDTVGEMPSLQVGLTQDKPFEISITTVDRGDND